MENLEQAVAYIANALWGDWLLYTLVGLGIYATFMTRGIQFTFLKLLPKGVLTSTGTKSKSDISSYQSLCTALSSCVGGGNIVGVATAIALGGPGAILWMWFSAFWGMATKFCEIVLGIMYRSYNDKGMPISGPMYYIQHGLGWSLLAQLMAILLFVQNGGGTIIQSNIIGQVVKEAFHVPYMLTAVVLAVIMIVVIRGELSRIVNISQTLVPIMATLYVLAGAIIVLIHVDQVPMMVANIWHSAFNVQAGIGGVAGYGIKEAMRYGLARGLYSNEAGEGSAAVLHGVAHVDHPVRQGFYGIIEVFIDTFVICSITGLTILITGVYSFHSNPATLTAAAFDSVFNGYRYVVYISLLLFCFTSIMSQWYFGNVSLTFLKWRRGNILYKAIFPVLIYIGTTSSVHFVWYVQDIALGLLIIPNIGALLFLIPRVKDSIRDFINTYYPVSKEIE